MSMFAILMQLTVPYPSKLGDCTCMRGSGAKCSLPACINNAGGVFG